MRGLFYIDQVDFLGSAQAGPVTFDEDSELLVDVTRLDAAGKARWVVRDGTTFYASEATFSSGVSTFSIPGRTAHGN